MIENDTLCTQDCMHLHIQIGKLTHDVYAKCVYHFLHKRKAIMASVYEIGISQIIVRNNQSIYHDQHHIKAQYKNCGKCEVSCTFCKYVIVKLPARSSVLIRILLY